MVKKGQYNGADYAADLMGVKSELWNTGRGRLQRCFASTNSTNLCFDRHFDDFLSNFGWYTGNFIGGQATFTFTPKLITCDIFY